MCAIKVTGAVTLKSATPYLHTAVDRPRVRERRTEARSSLADVDEADTAEGFELPGADLSGEELRCGSWRSRPTSSPARSAFSSTTGTATPANAQDYRSAATVLPDLARYRLEIEPTHNIPRWLRSFSTPSMIASTVVIASCSSPGSTFSPGYEG